MSGIATGTALAISAGVGAAGSIGGALIGSSAAGHAADTQAAAANQAAELQHEDAQQALAFEKQQYQQGQRNFAPFLGTGYSALANLSYLMGLPLPPGETYQLPGGEPGQGAVSSPFAAPPTFRRGPFFNDSADMADPERRRLEMTLSPDDAIGLRHAIGAGGGTGADAANPYLTPQPMSSLVNKSLGAYGSLMQPFTEKFTAPTAITEQNDPGYQARLNLSEQALERSAAARGNILTGGTAKDLGSFAQDYASNEYGNVYTRAWNEYANRYNIFQNNQANQFNRLADLSGIGQTTASQLGTLGNAAAGQVGNTLLSSGRLIGDQLNNAAAARASGYIGSANAFSNALSGLGGNVMNMYLLSQIMRNPGNNPVNDPLI